jgi:uncharacterized protein YndB with AHSA1/START domain
MNKEKTHKTENTSPFDFIVDKSTKMVYVNMEFDAELSLVWDAFTKAEILDQWYAPKPMVSKTKFMDFKVGGRRFYAMVNPTGEERWGIQRYTSITPKTNFKFVSLFSDKDENPELPGSDWDLNFVDEGDRTKVNISIYNESLERLERVLEGFKVGMKMTFENLHELLASGSLSGSSK